MKIYKLIIAVFMVVLNFVFFSCQKEDERYVHTNTTISAIYIRNTVGGTYVEGTIKTDSVIFEIPLAKKDEIDITNTLIYATIPVSAKVTPGFAGRHDLSSPQQFTVVNDDNEPHVYILRAVFLDY
jgi:hypothetical protein